MRTASDTNFNRGYEWWLMKEAKKRNPDIILDCLAWGAPGWIGGGNYYSQDMADYVVKFIKGAKDVYGLDINYTGIANERYYDVAWIKLLRKTLDTNGLNQVGIVVADQSQPDMIPFATPPTQFQFQIPVGYSLRAGGFLLVWADGQPALNNATNTNLHVNFTLAAAGADVAEGCPLDGDAAHFPLALPTPGKSNCVIKAGAVSLSAGGRRCNSAVCLSSRIAFKQRPTSAAASGWTWSVRQPMPSAHSCSATPRQASCRYAFIARSRHERSGEYAAKFNFQKNDFSKLIHEKTHLLFVYLDRRSLPERIRPNPFTGGRVAI